MKNNPLEELIKGNTPDYDNYSPSEEAISTNVVRGGNWQVNREPYKKTNRLLKFVEELNRAPKVYSQAVEVFQNQAAKKVAEMDDATFKKAYEDIVGAGADPATQSFFGYTKAHQEAVVEKAYQDIIPLELKDIARGFEAKLNDFNDISDFDDAVDKTVGEYFDSLDSRFNSSPFARNAHNVLRLGKEAKMKIQLHESYEAQAKQYINNQSIDKTRSALVDINDFEGIGDQEYNKYNIATRLEGKQPNNYLGYKLTEIYDANLLSNGGNKKEASESVREGTYQAIEYFMSLGTSEGVEQAEALFEAVFDEDVVVGNKEIFETSEAAGKEVEFRSRLRQLSIQQPQIALSLIHI